MEEVNMKAKTILTGIVTAALTFSLETMSIFAAAPAEGRNFIDSNNDGICDNCGMYCQFIDEDGDGICDYYNNWGAYGRGLGYVDETEMVYVIILYQEVVAAIEEDVAVMVTDGIIEDKNEETYAERTRGKQSYRTIF